MPPSSSYEQVPVELGSWGDNSRSSIDDEPVATTTQKGAPSPTRPSDSRNASTVSLHEIHRSEADGSVNNNGDKFRGHFGKIWKRLKCSFDDRPYEVKETWGNTIWHLTKRLITAGILISAIVLGAVGQTFSITNHTLWRKFQVSQDAQLAAFGLLNTILAILVRDSLGHISSTIITRWMVVKDGGGATPLDFEMNEELNKPWTAVANFHTRRKKNSWKFWDTLRFILSLFTGVCLLLQGAGINTVGMPKERWWPDTRFINPNPSDDRFFFDNKTMRVANVSRMSVWDRSWNTIREGGDVSWEISHAIAAMATLGALEEFYSTIEKTPGWQAVGDNSASPFSALNVTNTSTPSFQAVSVNGLATVEMWNEQRKTSTNPWARRAIGWFATLKLTGIFLDTACAETPGLTVGSWEASSHQNGTISLAIGPSGASSDSFPGATCTISVTQGLIAIQQWIISGSIDPNRPNYSINNWGSTPYPPVTPLPASSADASIAGELASWFAAVAPNLQNLSAARQTTNLTAIALRLSAAVVEREQGHSTADALAMVVATVFATFLTTFAWHFEGAADGGATQRQGPVRWQIYGAGSRLRWQWCIAAVIGVNVLVQLFDVALILCWRQARGLWLELGGMLVAANAADRLAPVGDDQGAGFVTEEGKFATFFVREKVDGEGAVGTATLVSEVECGEPGYAVLREEKAYGRQDEGHD